MVIGVTQLNSAGKAVFGCSIAFGVVATACVATRFWIRRTTGAKVGADDWLMVVGLVFFYVLIGLNNWAVFSIETNPANLQYYANFEMVSFIGEYMYASSITATRLGVLFFYLRLFHTKSFRNVAYVVGAVCVCWWIVSCIVDGFACTPIQHLWYPYTVPGTCLSTFEKYYLSKECIGIGIEAFILAMPVRMVFKLQMSFKRKIMLAIIFLLGGFVVITGIVRAVLIYQPDQDRVSFIKTDAWTLIHLGSATISACLPTFRPLAIKLAAITESGRQKYGYILRSLGGRLSGGSGGSGDSKERRGAPTNGATAPTQRDESESSSRKGIMGTTYATQAEHVDIPEYRVNETKTQGDQMA